MIYQSIGPGYEFIIFPKDEEEKVFDHLYISDDIDSFFIGVKHNTNAWTRRRKRLSTITKKLLTEKKCYIIEQLFSRGPSTLRIEL